MLHKHFIAIRTGDVNYTREKYYLILIYSKWTTKNRFHKIYWKFDPVIPVAHKSKENHLRKPATGGLKHQV